MSVTGYEQEMLDTYAGWNVRDRGVIAGESAPYYGRTADGIWVALFQIRQTEERFPITMESVVEVVPTPDYKGAAAASKKPKAIVEYRDGFVQVWVGNSKKGIGMVKKGGYRFDPQRHRWTVKRDDPQKVVEGLTRAGFNVDARLPEQAVA